MEEILVALFPAELAPVACQSIEFGRKIVNTEGMRVWRSGGASFLARKKWVAANILNKQP
jgi:hypothetical protein